VAVVTSVIVVTCVKEVTTVTSEREELV